MQRLWVLTNTILALKKNKKEVFSVEWALNTMIQLFPKIYESWTNFGHLHYLNNEAYWGDFNSSIKLWNYWNANADACPKTPSCPVINPLEMQMTEHWRKMNAEYP